MVFSASCIILLENEHMNFISRAALSKKYKQIHTETQKVFTTTHQNKLNYIYTLKKMVLYSTKSGSWLVIIAEPLLVLYSTMSLKVLYSTFVKWCYVEP